MKIAAVYFVDFLHRTLRTSFLLAGLISLVTINLSAQHGESARIYHMEGRDFAFTLRGEQTVISPEMLAGEGFNLERTGAIQTGPGTFLEMQLIPSGTVIKLSENTSLIYNGMDENGKFMDLSLLYGRILVVSGFSADGNRSLVIRSGGVSTRIEKADVGVDYYLESGNSSPRPICRVYVFRGSAEVFPYGRGGSSAYFGSAQSLTLEARECLSLDISSSYTFAEKTALSREIINYWGTHYFTGSPPVALNVPSIFEFMPDYSIFEGDIPPVKESMISYIPVDQAEGGKKQAPLINNRGKNVCLAVGLVLSVAAVTAQGVFHYQYIETGDKKYRDLFSFTYPVLATGLITTLAGILYNPSSARK